MKAVITSPIWRGETLKNEATFLSVQTTEFRENKNFDKLCDFSLFHNLQF